MHCDNGAGFGVGQSVVVSQLLVVVTEIFGQGVHLVVLHVWQQFLGTEMRAVELVIWIPYMIVLMQGLQHPFIEGNAMSHHRKSLHLVRHLTPHRRKQRRTIGVLLPDAVHLGRPKIVIVRHRLDKAVELVLDLVIPDDDQAHATRARQLGIGRLEIDGHEVMQMVFRDVRRPFRIGPIGQFPLLLFLFLPIPKHNGCKITEKPLQFGK